MRTIFRKIPDGAISQRPLSIKSENYKHSEIFGSDIEQPYIL